MRINTILLAADVDYTDGMAEAEVVQKQCELLARLIHRRICQGCRIHGMPLQTVWSACNLLGPVGLGVSVHWRRRAGVGLRWRRIDEICERR